MKGLSWCWFGLVKDDVMLLCMGKIYCPVWHYVFVMYGFWDNEVVIDLFKMYRVRGLSG